MRYLIFLVLTTLTLFGCGPGAPGGASQMDSGMAMNVDSAVMDMAENVSPIPMDATTRASEDSGDRDVTCPMPLVRGGGFTSMPETLVVSSERGNFWFCGDPYPGAAAGEENGYLGCCGSGRWRSLSDVGGRLHGGMLVRNVSSERIHYVYGRGDGTLALAVFPSTVELNSWFHVSGLEHRGINALDPGVCLNVTQITDEQLRALPQRNRVTLRPGSTYIKISSDPTVHGVGEGRRAHPLRYRGRTDSELRAWMPPSLVRTLPMYVFVDYTIGDRVTVDDTIPATCQLRVFDAPREQIESTLPAE